MPVFGNEWIKSSLRREIKKELFAIFRRMPVFACKRERGERREERGGRERERCKYHLYVFIHTWKCAELIFIQAYIGVSAEQCLHVASTMVRNTRINPLQTN